MNNRRIFFQYINKENGFIILDTIISSLIIMTMLGSIYFLQINAENYRNCKARIIAEYNADMYLDKMSIMHCNPCNTSFVSNNIEFYVEEKVIDNIAQIRICWNFKDKTHCIIQERRIKYEK